MTETTNLCIQSGEVHMAVELSRRSGRLDGIGVGSGLTWGGFCRKEERRLRERSSASVFVSPEMCVTDKVK